MTPDGSTLYVATYPQQLEQYPIGTDGALTALTPSEVGLYGCRADFLGVTPDGVPGITLNLAAGGGLAFNGSVLDVGRVAERRGRPRTCAVQGDLAERARARAASGRRLAHRLLHSVSMPRG